MSIGVYIHIPFCKAKCLYCDFLSFGAADCRYARRDIYASALLREIARKGRMTSSSVDTVFIGGGTPTVLSSEVLSLIIDSIRENFQILPDAEITVEANPGTVDFEKFKALKAAGVNRISMGFQSLDENVLRFLGRIHTPLQAADAFFAARKAGFDNINIDLIFGMPFDDRESFKSTLSAVAELAPEHISAYSLIVEENTPLCEMIDSGELSYPDDNTDREDYRFCKEFLCKAGYEQYEISNYSKPDKYSRHNMRYWRQDEYLGIGLGAASFLNGRRFSNSDDFDEYVTSNGNPSLREDCELSEKELADEFMMLGFRLMSGPDFYEFKDKFGMFPEEYCGNILEKLSCDGLIKRTVARRGFSLTEKGEDFANLVFEEFV